MTGMLEKMARAIVRERCADFDTISARDQAHAMNEAGAALRAIREPDEGMLEAAHRYHWGSGSWREATDDEERQNIAQMHTAMIDAILAEGEGK